jgi:hypothetical protein
MSKASAADLARYEELLDVVEGSDRKLVFGSPTCLVGGNMFFGASATGLFVKLPPELGEALLAEGGSPFMPMPGRPMGGYYLLPEGDVTHWVRQSFEYAKTLPWKKAKR